jgi:hypothetical protein
MSAVKPRTNSVRELQIDLKPIPLASWVAEERRFREQLVRREPGKGDIPGIKCRRSENGKYINYSQSEYEGLSSAIKEMRKGFSERMDVPAYTQLFSDHKDKFYPYFVSCSSSLYNDFVSAHERLSITVPDLYNKRYDVEIGVFASELDERDLVPYAHFVPIFKQLGAASGPLCVSIVYRDRASATIHTLAAVFWKEEGRYFGGFYDPLYFYRADDKQYIKPICAMYITFQILFQKYVGAPITLVNLSQFCLTTSKGVHCVQYMLDAEYCTIYSFYFFYMYARHGFPTNFVGHHSLPKVVHDTFIVRPADLQRGPCVATNHATLTLIHFALNLMLRYSKNPAVVNVAIHTHDLLRTTTTYSFLPKGLLDWGRELVKDVPDSIRNKFLSTNDEEESMKIVLPVLKRAFFSPPNLADAILSFAVGAGAGAHRRSSSSSRNSTKRASPSRSKSTSGSASGGYRRQTRRRSSRR